MFDDLTQNEYRIEWNPTEFAPVARIHVGGVRTSAFIHMDVPERPQFITEEQWQEVERLKNQHPF